MLIKVSAATREMLREAGILSPLTIIELVDLGVKLTAAALNKLPKEDIDALRICADSEEIIKTLSRLSF